MLHIDLWQWYINITITILDIIHCPGFYRERGGEEKVGGGGSVRHYHIGGGVIETGFGSLKVPRQCPLVLLVEARLVFGICSILIFKGVGAAVVGRNVI
jgi:hypothetical protein